MNHYKIATTLALAGLAIGSLGAAHAATGVGHATAEVVTPLTITTGQALNFGRFAVGSTGGNVTVDGVGAITADPDIDLLGGTGAQQGTFTVEGVAGQAISVSVGTATLSDGAGNTMGLAPTSVGSTTIGGTGRVTLNVGGVLTVGADQPAGVYNTTNTGGSPYTLTVNYQ